MTSPYIEPSHRLPDVSESKRWEWRECPICLGQRCAECEGCGGGTACEAITFADYEFREKTNWRIV